MAVEDAQTQSLLDRAARGDQPAIARLLALHRGRLRRMISARMDPRLAARLDPSDVVQEAAVVAAQRLPEYLKRRDCAFYPWLRHIAWERLVQLHRHHLHARRRSVKREVPLEMHLPDESVTLFAASLPASRSSPSRQLLRDELRGRVRAALDDLGPQDREVLILRHLEQLSMNEVAEVLVISLAAAQSRYRRAVERLHDLLSGEFPGANR